MILHDLKTLWVIRALFDPILGLRDRFPIELDQG